MELEVKMTGTLAYALFFKYSVEIILPELPHLEAVHRYRVCLIHIA